MAIVVLGCLIACGDSEPTGPIEITLTWNEDIDIDLIVDGEKGYRQGGSEDAQVGPGSESLTLASGNHSIGVCNNSASGVANTTITIDIPGMGVETRSTTISNEPGKSKWHAFSIDCATGIITDINTFE